MALAPIAPLTQLSDATLAAFRERMERGSYSETTLSLAESVAPGQFDSIRLPLVRWALRRLGEARTDLALLFAYATPLETDRARAVLSGPVTDALVEAGVLENHGTTVRSRFRLLPLDGSYILSDDPTAGGDAVMGPGPTTWQLVKLLPADLAGDVLDLGCGAGTLALSAARRTRGNVLGTDVNERAVALARFNARLNDVRVDFQVGDLYAPAVGRRFSTIVCQPPYVLQPPGTPGVTYLHGGPLGDALALRALGGAPALLTEGGRALFLFDAPVLRDQPLHARVREALGNATVDVLLLTSPGPSPDLQAVGYASLEVPDFGEAYEAAVLRYREHVEAIQVSEFSRVLAVLRRIAGDGPGFTASVTVPRLEGMDAVVLARGLAGLDLACLDDVALGHARVRVAPRARWIEDRDSADLEAPAVRTVRFPPGSLSVPRELSEASWALLAVLDSTPDVRSAVAEYATLCNSTSEQVRRQVLDFVREGLGRGLLAPA